MSDAEELKQAGGGFFHIDRRTWRLLCGRGDMHEVAAYLTIAQGTNASNRLSSWSAKSIEKVTGLHSSRARAAIERLIANGYLARTEDSKRTRPHYELQPFTVVHAIALSEAQREEAYRYRRMVEAIADKTERKAVRLLLSEYIIRGLAWKVDDGHSIAPAPAPELIWLPNTLVIGTIEGEKSPLRRLRSSGDLSALRLLVDLYYAQNLSADGGVSRRVMHQNYERKRLGERGRHVIWGFQPERCTVNPQPETQSFWDVASKSGDYVSQDNHVWEAVETLLRMGLIHCVPHLVENEDPDCEIIHGCAWDQSGEAVEVELADLAEAAGKFMLDEEMYRVATEVEGWNVVLPMWDTQTKVQMVGIYRLKYRPQTSLTSDWMSRMHESAEEWRKMYEKLRPSFQKATGTFSFD